jgi:hypothetical protein
MSCHTSFSSRETRSACMSISDVCAVSKLLDLDQQPGHWGGCFPRKSRHETARFASLSTPLTFCSALAAQPRSMASSMQNPQHP